MISGVTGQQLIPESEHLRLVRDVADMRADLNAGPCLGPRQVSRPAHGIRVEVAGRDRAPQRRELADKLPAHAGATAGHDRELVRKRVHRHAPPVIGIDRCDTFSARSRYLSIARLYSSKDG